MTLERGGGGGRRERERDILSAPDPLSCRLCVIHEGMHELVMRVCGLRRARGLRGGGLKNKGRRDGAKTRAAIWSLKFKFKERRAAFQR